MAVWDLAPGAECPVTPNRAARRGAVLTSKELAERAESLGARVELRGGRYRVYPPDPTKPPVFFGTRLHRGSEYRNIVGQLRRVGLDVLPEPPKEPPMPSPVDVAESVARNGAGRKPAASTAALAELREQVAAMLEMLAEAETRDRVLGERLDRLTARVDATPGAPPERDPTAELDEAILALMKATPIKLLAAVVAENLTGERVDPVQVDERLRALAAAGRVLAQPTGPGAATCFYHLPINGQRKRTAPD